MCVPIISAGEAGVTDIVTSDSERIVCVYVRALVDERIDSRRCFAPLSPSPPPPPPKSSQLRGLIDTILRHKKQREGGGEAGPEAAAPLSDAEEYAKEHAEKIQEQIDLVDRVSAGNFEMQNALAGLREKIQNGRRLFQTQHQTHSLSSSALQLDAFGGGPVLGITRSECSTLCAAIGNSSVQDECVGTATRMLNPGDLTDLSVAACWLLKSLGSCKSIDFAASIYARRDTNPCNLPTETQNPLCVQLAPSRIDLRVLDFAMAAASCRNGRGRPKMPTPQNSIEVRNLNL